MPEVSRITLKHGSVAEILSGIEQDLLPEEIARNPLAQWVMDFDPLKKQDDQRSFLTDNLDWDNPYKWVTQLYGYIVTDILQVQMPFYFASLFHIGRQWQAAVFSLQSIASVEQPENLFVSARNLSSLSERSQHGVDLSQESSLTLIRNMCDLGREQQSRRLNHAQVWWSIWKEEVILFREAVYELEKYYNAFEGREQSPDRIFRPMMRILTFSMQGSALRKEMQQEGVQFKREIDIQPSTRLGVSQQYWWLLLLLTLIRDDKHGAAGYRFSKRDLLLASQTETILEILRRKYQEEDPFIRYGAGKSAPTLEFLELIRENVLPNGSDSPWLHSWKRSLDPDPQKYDDLPVPKKRDSLASAVRSADSTIKRHLTEQRYITESWEDFLQHQFEKHWIQAVGMLAGRKNRDARPPNLPWSTATFQQFIADVVAGLNEIGYSLTVPKTTRLMTLLETASRSKNRNIDW